MHHIKLIFFITVLPLVATPGPDIIYIMTRGMAQGRRAAVVSTLGICAGYAVHTVLAVMGLTAMLYASVTLFNIVKYIGALYLVYLGFLFIRSKAQIEFKGDGRKMSTRRTFLTGMATSILNPKGILLFFAYFPQFISVDQTAAPQLLLIGVLFILMCGLVYGAYGFFSGSIGDRLSAQPRVAGAMRWLTGSVLIGLGLRMALPERR